MDFLAATAIGNDGWLIKHKRFGTLSSGSGDALMELVSPQGKSQIELAAEVGDYLNHFEFIAAAIKNGAMDEKLYEDPQNGMRYRMGPGREVRFCCTNSPKASKSAHQFREPS